MQNETKIQWASLATVVLATSCTQGPTESIERLEPVVESVAVPSAAPSAGSPSAPRTHSRTTPERIVTVAVDETSDRRLSAVENYFDSPEFQRDLERSFVSRGKKEPPLSEDEIDALPKIYELIRDEDYDRALRRIEQEIEDEPTANYWYLAGQIHFQNGRHELAAAAYDNAIELFPNFLDAWSRKAILHMKLTADDRFAELPPDQAGGKAVAFEREQYEEAAEALREVLRLGAVDERTYGFYAMTQLYFEHYMKAEMAFRSALMLSESNSHFEENWKTGLAQTLLRQRRYADAAALLGELLETDPSRADLWLLQGNAYLGTGKTEDAAANFQIADELGGASAAALDLLADIYTNDGLSELATQTYLRAFEEGSRSPSRALRGARLMLQRGEVESVMSLLAGIEASLGDSMSADDTADMLKLKAQVAVRQGDAESNIEILEEILEEIIENNPLDGDALILLGDALGRQAAQLDDDSASDTKLAEAGQAFATAAAIEGFEADALLKHARLLVGRKRYEQAVPLLKASLQANDRENVRAYMKEVERAAKRAAN